MKNLISYAALLGLGLTIAPSVSFAQNYIPPTAYGGPNVIVNMDVLNPGAMAPTPLTSRPSGLRSRSEARANVPLRLRRPAAPHHSTIAAPQPMAQAPLVLKKPAQRQITSTPLAPLSPAFDPTITAPTPQFAANKPAPDFSAKELVKAAQPTRLTNPAPIATPKLATDTQTRQRELLAKAREDVLYDEGTKAVTQTTERTIAEIENIAPSAPKMMAGAEMPAPMPPTAELNSVMAPPLARAPAIPTFVDRAPKQVEKPMEMASLAAPTQITPPPAPITAAPVQAMALDGQDSFRLLFGGQSADLSSDYVAALDQVAARLTNSKDAKIQLRAFADGTPETTSKARRLSLTRALTVRSYLLDKGVSATAMDVRALGVAPVQADTSPDRVDIVFIR